MKREENLKDLSKWEIFKTYFSTSKIIWTGKTFSKEKGSLSIKEKKQDWISIVGAAEEV